MKVLERHQADQLWNDFWHSLRREWFKVEVLQDYAGEDDGPSLQKWLAGDKKGGLTAMKLDEAPDFTANCQEKLAQGVKLRRIHVIERPLTPYMEWEIEFYKQISIPKRGEQVLLVDKKQTKGLNMPAGDFMIFDDQKAVVNKYNSRGRVVERTFYDETDDITNLVVLKRELMALAKPL